MHTLKIMNRGLLSLALLVGLSSSYQAQAMGGARQFFSTLREATRNSNIIGTMVETTKNAFNSRARLALGTGSLLLGTLLAIPRYTNFMKLTNLGKYRLNSLTRALIDISIHSLVYNAPAPQDGTKLPPPFSQELFGRAGNFVRNCLISVPLAYVGLANIKAVTGAIVKEYKAIKARKVEQSAYTALAGGANSTPGPWSIVSAYTGVPTTFEFSLSDRHPFPVFQIQELRAHEPRLLEDGGIIIPLTAFHVPVLEASGSPGDRSLYTLTVPPTGAATLARATAGDTGLTRNEVALGAMDPALVTSTTQSKELPNNTVCTINITRDPGNPNLFHIRGSRR
jgi:hypothetical protein